jgi:hypothetical protein
MKNASRTSVHDVSTLAPGTPAVMLAKFGEIESESGPLSVATNTGFAAVGR